MANPYDFTSGYLQAKALKNQEEESKNTSFYRGRALELQGESIAAQKANYERIGKAEDTRNELLRTQVDANAAETRARTGNLGRTGRLLDKRIQITDQFLGLQNPSSPPKLGNKSLSPTSSLTGPFTSPTSFGVYSLPDLASLNEPEDSTESGLGPDFNQNGSYTGSYAPATAIPVRAANGVFNDAGRAVGVFANPEYQGLAPSPKYSGIKPSPAQTQAIAGGTPSGPALQVDAAIPGSAEPVGELPGKSRSLAIPPSQSAPVAASAPVDVVAMVREENPAVAAKIENTIRKATSAETAKMLNQFAVLDWAEGKINAGQLQDQVEKARIYQAEGFARAASMALTGNTKQAMKMFAEQGSDDGSEVDSLVVEKITKSIPGSKAKDVYNGLRIKYKDGEQMLFDPKDFLVQTASLKAALDFRAQGDNSLRDDERAAETNRNNAAATAENRAARLEANQTQNESNARFKFLNILGVEAKQDFDRVADQLKNDPRFIGNEEARNKLLAAKEQDVAQRRRLAEVNYDLGNPRVSYGAVQDALASKQDVFVKNGAPVVFETPDGFRAFKHQNGVFLPESLYKQEPAVQPTPQQTAIPGPAGRQRPPQTPIIPTPVVPGRVQQMKDRFNALEVERQSAEKLRGTRGGVAQEWAPGGMKRMQYDSLREALSASQSN